MKQKVNAEFLFTSEHDPEIKLTLYVDYVALTYDIVQSGQEGIMPRLNGFETSNNRDYFNLALEALDFVDKKLYNKNLPF